jgi:glycosyltransferase involved in cell wall biosynthesis
MSKPKLIRITTIPESLEKLLEGQLAYMQTYFDITAVSSNQTYLETYANKENVRFFMVPLTRKITPIKDLKAVYILYRFLKKENPEIVHTHTPKAGTIGMLAAKLAGVKHRLHTVAGLPLMEAKGFKRTILNTVEWLTYKCATKVYPNSHGLKDFIIKEKFCAINKLKVIGHGSSNGIDTDYFDPSLFTEQNHLELRADMGIPKDDFIFLFVGRMVADKGINELVEAFSKLSTLYNNVSLVLVGPLETELDPLENTTILMIEKHSKIYDTGFQTDVRKYYAFAKALVFPSYREGFPNVVLQAGAMGLPSIVSDINGCNEIIQEGINGNIVPVKSVLALQNVMEEMIKNEKEFQFKQSKARTIITDSYQRKVIWSSILKEYEQLLKLS